MSTHLPALLFALPLLLASILLLVESRGAVLQRALSLAGAVLWTLLAAAMVVEVADGTILVYLVGNWPARLGIALVVDRLGAGLVLATSVLGMLSLLYASTGWDRRVLHFHALFHLQLAGINGAFMTGDVFNLFVCFEVMLIASYGLLLGGGFGERMRAGFRYVTLNIALSCLFLIGVALLYGVTGTLNMAELAAAVAALPAGSQAIVKIAAAMLLVVFVAKAALLPLHLWLPQTYAAAPAAIAALFAILTKVGVYAYLRVFGLLFGEGAGPLEGLFREWLLPAAGLGVLLAAAGALGTSNLRRLAAYMVVMSSSTLFIALSVPTAQAWAAALYYMVHSIFAGAALFLVVDQIVRQRPDAHEGLEAPDSLRQPVLLGVLFLAVAMAVIGLPPLSGFIGKASILAAMPDQVAPWAFSTILLSSLIALIAFSRVGSQVFWKAEPSASGDARPSQPAQLAATIAAVGIALALSLAAEPVMRYAQGAAAQALSPAGYVESVRGALPHAKEDLR